MTRAFGDIACHRCEAVEPCRTHAIGERIDQARHIGFRFLNERGPSLFGVQWLGQSGGERHQLNAKARINGFDALAQEFGEPFDVAHRQAVLTRAA